MQHRPMAIPLPVDEHETPLMTRGVRVLLAINVVMLFLQWTLVSDADAFAVLGFQDASLQRTLWSTITYMFVHYGVWHLLVTVSPRLTFVPRREAALRTRAFALHLLPWGRGGGTAPRPVGRVSMVLRAAPPRG